MRRSCKRTTRPTLEPLESRTLLATCHVTRLGDFGAGADIGGGHSRGDLRFCVNYANTNPGPDVITFSRTGTINLSGGLPDLTSEIDIQGPGTGQLTVRRNTVGNYRIFTVAPGATVRLAGLDMINGLVQNDAGGGILNRGTLTLEDVRLAGNRATNSGNYQLVTGGGIHNEGMLTINRSRIVSNISTNNLATATDRYSYGGVYNEGTLSINDSTLSNNSAQANSDEYSVANGGGLYNVGGTVTIRRSTLANNRAEADAQDLAWGQGGGIYTVGGLLTVQDSAISGNTADGSDVGDGGAGNGGGIYSTGDGDGILSNSTVTNNNGWGTGWPPFVSGIYIHGSWTITHSTIAGNTGGIDLFANPSHASLTMRHSIVDVLEGPLLGSGYNLVRYYGGGTGYVPSDILGVDPMLGPLTDNGGPTQTMALLPGSLAIDAGDPSPTDPPLYDQRGPGFPRIVNGQIDIGAYEVQATGISSQVPNLVLLSTADLDDDEWENRQ
jgi:hypothetical protein